VQALHVIFDAISGLTIGIDARAASEEIAGGGRVVRELLRALPGDHRYRLYARTRWEEPLDDRFTWVLSPRKDPYWNLGAAVRASADCDVLLSTNSYLTAWFTTVPTVLEIYDMVAFDAALRPSPRAGAIERATLAPALRRAAAAVCISQATADAVAARYPWAKDKLVASPLGASPALRPEPADDLPERFVLAVGTLEPRKNLPRLVEAYRGLPAHVRAGTPLLVAGRVGWEAGETLTALKAADAQILGRVSDARLAALYAHCTVFAYPSLAEGFGLPVLEAMQAGAAVLTSDVSSLPEVGGDAVEYADPTDVASIRTGLERLLTDDARRAGLRAQAVERAARFSWAEHAHDTLRVLEAAATRGRRGPRAAGR
jgi:glycosyltransferase involved in cell wall biosynthesis